MFTSGSSCLCLLKQDSASLIDHLIQALTPRGIGVTRSFDLQATRAVHTGCGCPHHGTSQCACQLIVLLLYQDGQPPLTLVLEGQAGMTSVSAVYTPGQAVDSQMIDLVIEALRPADIVDLGGETISANGANNE